MTIEEKIIRKPLTFATSVTCRGGIFQPVSHVPMEKLRIPVKKPVVLENQWCKISIEGTFLTQTHLNVMEAVVAVHHFLKETESDGRIKIVYSPQKVLDYLGMDTNDYQWVVDKLKEISSCLVKINTKKFKAYGRIVDFQIQPEDEIQKTTLYYVEFGPFFKALQLYDVSINYKELIPNILKLKHAVTQALVRFCLSHDILNMDLIEILESINSLSDSIDSRTKRRIIQYVISEQEALKRDFGIEIKKMENGRKGIFYKKHDKVYFKSGIPFVEEKAPDVVKKEQTTKVILETALTQEVPEGRVGIVGAKPIFIEEDE